MPAYKDNNGTWYCKFYYQDYEGNNKQKFKRGFTLKREAQEFEREFLDKQQYQPEMKLISFLELYKKDIYPQLREHTIQAKNYKYNRIIPYLGDIPISQIEAKDVKKWQNEMIKLGFSSGHIKGLQKELSALFNHAIKFYKLSDNPCRKAGQVKIPNEMVEDMRFWTYEEYCQVINHITSIKSKTAVNLLYWTGMRKGELLALKWSDVDLENKTLNINKSLQRLRGRNVITQTKTYESRQILLPDTTINRLKEYKTSLYDPSPESHIFEWEKKFIEDGIKEGSSLSDIKRIHVHGLRHSHASYLISKGVNIILISKRLGHKDPSLTLDTYSHFYKSDEIGMIDLMNSEFDPNNQ